MGFEFAVVKGKTVHSVIHRSLQECVDVVEAAYLTHHAGATVNPDSYFLRFPDNPSARIIALPAYLGGRFDVSGLKWIASYPQNITKGFPRASAVLVLNRPDTGYPYALLEASIISAARTAASACLAARFLDGGRKRAPSVGVVGSGLIARYLLTFLQGTGWELGKVRLYDASPEEAARLARRLSEGTPRLEAEACADLEELVTQSELLAFATTAPTPYLMDPALFAHAPRVLHISLRDLAPEILLASNNVVDDVEHVMKADTSPHLAEKRVGHRQFVNGSLAELITGKFVLDRRRATIFSPFGMGILDLAVGSWVHQQALASGEAVRFDDFFFDLVR